MPINSKYFQTVCDRKEGTVNYKIVRPLGNPMVMFSEIDGTALTAFHLKCNSSDSVKAIITKRPTNLNNVDADFQGIIDTDNQEVAFVVSNLTDRYLSFCVKRNDRVLNEINGLKPYDSYELACDKEDSTAFVLKTTPDSSGQKISVESSEKSKTHEKLGSYLEILFYPESIPVLVEKFEKTVWKCIDMFWMIEMVKPDVAPMNDMVNEPMFLDGIEPAHASGWRGQIVPNRSRQMEPMRYGLRSQQGPGIIDRITSFLGFGNNAESINQSSSLEGYVNESMSATVPTSRFILKTHCAGMFLDHHEKIEEGETEEIDYIDEGDEYADEEDDNECFSERAEKRGKIQESYEQRENKKTINQSKIAHIDKGKHIEVRSKNIAIDISYKTPSVKCKIALSVAYETLVVKTQDQSVFTEKANQMLEDLIANIDKKDLRLLFLIEKVYREDICAICQCDDPDTVIYQCGHQCCHFDCVENKMVTCPLCRMIVGGFVKLNVKA